MPHDGNQWELLVGKPYIGTETLFKPTRSPVSAVQVWYRGKMTTNRSKFATAIVGIAVAAQVILSQARAEVTLPAASAGSRVTVITDVMSPLTQSFSKPIKGSYAAFYNIASLHIDRNIVDMFENTLRPKYQIVEFVVDIQRLRDKTRDLYLEKGRSLPMLQEVGIVPADYVVYITESRHGPKTSCDLYGEGEPYKGPIQDIVIYELEGKTGLVYGIASQVDVLVLDKNFTIIAASYPACASVPLPIELWPDPLVTKDDAYAFQNLLMKLVLIKDLLVKTVTEAALTQ